MAPFFTGLAKNLGGFGFGRLSGGDGITGPSIISTGGTKIEDVNTLTTYHVFTSPSSSSPFTVGSSVDVFYLVVAGGGGGGYNSGGGGGAGGLRSNHPDIPAPLRGGTLSLVSGTTYSVTVGTGGPAGTSTPRNGGGSTLTHPGGNIVTTGGGTGGNTETPGGPGGSGGGGGNHFSGSSTTGGSATPPGQGNAGGGQSAPASGTSGGGGGGGSGAPGGSTGSPQPAPLRGRGGDGLQLPSLPAIAISPAIPAPQRSSFTSAVGPTGWFAGGGGGAVDFSLGGITPDGSCTGGQGGGGNGQAPSNTSGETDGIYGTGGGGGGGVPQGKAGGDGIVIIYYPWV